jgi:8-oxo-dGTP pyrophosphatase MutT (NUDIX family)
MTAAEAIARLRPNLLEADVAAALEPPGALESAVLVPLVDAGEELRIVLTRRRDDMRSHAGEYSFPGGRRDPGEKTLIHTALRETHEEVGIEPSRVQVIGALQPTATIATSWSLHPFVGLVPESSAFIAGVDEVAEVLEIPLLGLIESRTRKRLSRRDVAFRTSVYPIGERVIWGATARILSDLAERITAAEL